MAKQAIHGLGGVGKTRLAVEYAWRSMADYATCLFVEADSPENLDRNLAGLCGPRVLDLPEQSAQEQELQAAAVLRWLNAHPGWLLIIDNVDGPEAAAAVDLLLPSLQNGQVLITSRRSDWGGGVHSLSLDTLSEADAADFLLEKTADRRTPTATDAADAVRLAQTLGGLALALEQAGAFINKIRISLRDYQARWAQSGAQAARMARSPGHELSDEPGGDLGDQFRAAHGGGAGAAQPVVLVRARSDSARAIRSGVRSGGPGGTGGRYRDARRAHPGAPDLEDLLDELRDLSLVKWESGNRSFSVHRLVQQMTRERLDGDARRPALSAALRLVNQAVPIRSATR